MDIFPPQYTQKQEAIGARKRAIVILNLCLKHGRSAESLFKNTYD